MKRDLDLVRKILLQCEAIDEPDAQQIDLSEYPEAQQKEHRYLIWKAGLARGFDGTTNMGYDAVLDGLTWAGHDFLDDTRNPKMWAKIKETIKAAGVAATIETVKAVAKRLTAEALGTLE